MKVAIIAVAKNEELYIKEWLDYHLKIGFDAVILADNDDEMVLSGYSSENVFIEDYLGEKRVQSVAYTELYQKYRKDFDWIAFFDIDEFLVLDGFSNVKEFLSEYTADEVRLNEKHFTDNDMLDVVYGNYNVFDRFLYEADTPDLNRYLKTFVNTRVEAKKVYGHGIYDHTLYAVDVLNNQIEADSLKSKNILLVKAWFNHYRTKTIGEYIRQKLFRGGPNNNPSRYRDWERYFFQTNRWSEEKINYAKKLIECLK